MSSKNLIAVAMLALAMLAGGGAMVVHAIPGRGGDGPANDNIAVVDMELLYNSSDLPQVLAQRAAQLEMQAQERLDALSNAKFLDLKELQEYGELIGKAQPDAAQTARMKALKEISGQREAELETLRVTPAEKLTAENKTRMRTLNDMSHLIDRVLPSVQNDFAQDQAERLRTLRRAQVAQLRGVVGEVAKGKGFVHVFDVNALVYSANDLTPLVLKKIKPGK